jgi:protein SCO1/2
VSVLNALSRVLAVWVVCVMCLVSSAPNVQAQVAGAPAPGYRMAPGASASSVPAPLREIGFDRNLDRQVPLDLPFRDEADRLVPLRHFFGGKPVVLAFVYYSCPMLCSQVLASLTNTLRTLSLEPGRDFEVVAISFDPRETPAIAAAKKAEYVARYGRPSAEDGWHFLTADEASIGPVTRAAGFRYAWDEQTKQFAHPAGVIVLTPNGRPARYLFGVEYGPRDLRLALVEASTAASDRVDALLLYCYHYDPMTGRCSLVVMRLLRIAGLGTVLALAAFITIAVKRERRRQATSTV